MKIASLLRKYSIQPKRSLGQNFLVNESVARRIVELSELTSEDTVIEIGTGLGI
ncbi:MAG TPA: ribosomal RNA small subunit methyltransferase A, partial [Kosmotogaceae bacterium]|nr:ribosomal RNA small subunit methyltransferase A [Kosmotogaceae bacterium]